MLPACASVILIMGFILLLMIVLYIFPKLLARVIPRSLEHFPFWLFPLYSLFMFPFFHGSGMGSSFGHGLLHLVVC